MNLRGLGRVFRPKYSDRTTGEKKVSAVWWVEYYHRGLKRREGAGSTNRADAVRLLKRRIGEIGRGQRILGRDVERVTFDDLAAMLVSDYTANERRSLKRIGTASAHLRGVFAGRAIDITPGRIMAYVAVRQTEGAANATINRELAALKRMLSLGERAGKVAARPYIGMLEERNTRTGFFEPDEFRALLSHLPDDIRPVFETAYITGWRVTSEILTRQWAHVDFTAGWLRLEPGETKNCEGRMFPLTPELRAVLERQRERTDALQRTSGRTIPWVLHRDGEPIRHFRRSWLTACKRAGLSVTVQHDGKTVALATRIPHDFRRTAVRNLERAGVPRSAAMKMVGHKTEAIYRRYAIADEALLRESALKLSALHQAQQVMPRRVIAFAEPRRAQAKSGQSAGCQ